MFNYYRHFVTGEAAIIRIEALKGGKTGTSKLLWSEEMRDAFQAAKRLTPQCTS
jgi:hypothetical protein